MGFINQKYTPLGKNIPKKKCKGFTLKDAKLNKLIKLILIIYAAFLKGFIFLKKLLLLQALFFLYL